MAALHGNTDTRQRLSACRRCAPAQRAVALYICPRLCHIRHVVVTMLCDLAERYAGKLYNPAFLQSQGLPPPPWLLAEGAQPAAEGAGRAARLQQALAEAMAEALPPAAP